MLRITKLADYATVIMCHLAKQPADAAFSVAQIAKSVSLGEATVSKVLKMLSAASLVDSQRGVRGGYSISGKPSSISLAAVITAIESRPAITECSEGSASCLHDKTCGLKSNWQLISRLVLNTLDRITLADMNTPLCQRSLLSMALAETPVHIKNRNKNDK